MKVLRESTDVLEELPVSFITDYISKGWEEVGYLKEASSAIVSEYSNTEKIEQSMQDLMDAYLIFIGQMEAYLQEKENIATEETAAAPTEIKHELPEAELEIKPIVEPTEKPDTPAMDIEEVEPEEVEPLTVEPTADTSKTASNDPFEFFVDFDEPDMSKPRLSDEDLYGEEDSEQSYNKLRSQLRD